MHGAFLSGLREASCILHASRSRTNGSADPKKCLQKNLRICNGILLDLFKEPDLTFGNFSFVFDAFAMEDPKAMGLMRVTFGKTRNEACRNCISEEESEEQRQSTESQFQALHLYAILSREQALHMQLVSGDDKSRLTLVCKKFGLKLMGCKSTCALGSSLITSISGARRGRNRQRRPMHCKVGF